MLAVVLQVREGRLQTLLWQRARQPDAGAWALPGGTLEPDETLEASIRRHLAAKVDVRELAHLEQLGSWSDPGRNPAHRELATAFLGIVPADVDPQLPEDTAWQPVDGLPALAFDHGEIVLAGRERLRGKLSYTNVGFALAPPIVHALRAARPLRSRPRARRLGHEPEARACCDATCSRRRGRAASRDAPADVPPRCTDSGFGQLEITDPFATLRPPG